MPHTAALDALLHAFREEIAWLQMRAEDFTEREPETAQSYIHRARNLQAMLEGYERLKAKEA
jgi:hypothetical protein